MKLSVLLSTLLLCTPVLAQDDDCGDVKGLESKAYEDIQQFIKFTTKKDSAHCEEVYKLFDQKYQELSTHIYKQYREYLNRFLTTYTAEMDAVKEFERLVAEMQLGPGTKLLKEHQEKKTQASADALLTHLIARYKVNKNLPVEQDCDIKLKKGQKMSQLNEKLISKEARLDTTNVCQLLGHKGVEYPSHQTTIRFQVQEGRAMVFFCQQLFDSRKGVLYSSKASCLAYDLNASKMILGDQRQTHIFKGQRPFDISDVRMIIAKSRGYVPLTYAEFLRKNRNVLPAEPKRFYSKLPKECANTAKTDEWIEKARISLIDAEKESGFIEN